jgi:hypothetical protein
MGSRRLLRYFSSRVASQLCAQLLSRGGVSARFPLSFDVVELRSGSIENELHRLDQSRRLEFSQEITGADQSHAFVNDRAAMSYCSVMRGKPLWPSDVSAGSLERRPRRFPLGGRRKERPC